MKLIDENKQQSRLKNRVLVYIRINEKDQEEWPFKKTFFTWFDKKDRIKSKLHDFSIQPFFTEYK